MKIESLKHRIIGSLDARFSDSMIQCSDDSIRPAFTLIELLVTIGIIALLAGILVPVVTHSMAKAHKIRLEGDLQTISTALEAYRSDFGDYPRPEYESGIANSGSVPNPPTGAEILCRALIAPAPATDAKAASHTIPWQDGADGPGFRLRGTQGRVYGPYLKADAFKIYSYDPTGSGQYWSEKDSQFNPLLAFIGDIDGNPILYFPARSARPDITKSYNTPPPGYVGLSSQTNHNREALFDADDNWAYMHHLYQDEKSLWRSAADQTEGASTSSYGDLGYKRICIMFGDYTPGGSKNCDGAIDAPGEHAVNQPFVLWCAGADGKFGPDSTTPSSSDLNKLDDATNIP